MKNLIVFDTETIGLEKQFIYNLGYVILDGDTGEVKATRDLVIRQIWNNRPLMATAYYAKKRPIYTKRMKAKKTIQVSWGRACQIMAKDIKDYEVADGYAYNSPFDVKGFYFNHLFYRNKTRPLDAINVYDIMDEISIITDTQEYKDFCKNNNFLCKNGRVKKTAESMFAFLTNNPNYKEEHTALEDSKIEAYILMECWKRLRK